MSSKKTTTRKRVNMSQPAQILKQRQVARVRALLAEERRQAQSRKMFENFFKQMAVEGYNNNNSHGSVIASMHSTIKKNSQKRKTRRLRR